MINVMTEKNKMLWEFLTGALTQAWGQGSRNSFGQVFHCSQVKQLRTVSIILEL